MSKEEIQKLIFSDADEQKIADELIKWFIKKPSLLQERFLFDRTFFHLLILSNKARTLELLFDSEFWKKIPAKEWQEIADLPDRHGHTLTHYLVRADEKFQTALKTFLRMFPKQLNRINDNHKNTPLQEAILSKKVWSIKILVGESNCEYPPILLQLCQGNLELLNAVFSTNLGEMNSLSLKDLRSQHMDQFRQAFPAISGRTSSKNSPSNEKDLAPSEKKSNSKEFSIDQILKEGADCKEAQEISSKEVLSLLEQMSTVYKKQKRSPTYNLLQTQFNNLCLGHFLPRDLALIKEPPEVKDILNEALNTLLSNAQQLYLDNEDKKIKVLQNFVYIIVPLMTKFDSAPRAIPVSKEFTENRALEVLWLITSGQENPKSRGIFNFEKITQRALGLLCSMSLFDIFINLRKLYPYLDFDQKLVANYIVLQLLYYNAINKIIPETDIDLQLSLFCKLNVDPEKGLGTLGVTINHHLNQLHLLNSQYTHNPLFRNVSLLNTELSQPQMAQSPLSFDEVVNRALAKKRASRTEEVQIIAHELRMLSLKFYQQVSIQEFDDNNWTKVDTCPEASEKGHHCDSQCKKVGKSTLSPSIVESMLHCNKLNSYFIVKVLTQPAENIVNALQLIIEIGLELCPLDDERFNDVNQLMTITSILSTASINRILNIAKEKLSSRENNCIEEFDRLVDKGRNFKFMRELYNSSRKTFPFLGLLLTDVTFVNDGNSAPISKFELGGLVLKQVMEVKLLINFERIVFQTNLPQILAKYIPANDDNLYRLSLRRQPRATDVILLKEGIEGLSETLDTIVKEFLPQDIIPSIMVNKKQHQSNQVPQLLIDLFNSQFKALKKENKSKPQKEMEVEFKLLAAALNNKLKPLIFNLIQVLNAHYVPLKLSEPKELKVFIDQLEVLEKRLNKVLTKQTESEFTRTGSKFFKINSSSDSGSSRSERSSTPRSQQS